MQKFDVTIAGEINLDLILSGLPSAMPLERELLASGFDMTLGSSSAITAHNLAALGMAVGFVTLVGPDPLGKNALDRLQEKGVDLSKIRRSSSGTTTGVTVLLTHPGQKERHILTYPGTMSEMQVGDLDVEYLKAGRHFHLSSLFLQKGLQPGLPALFRDLKQAGLTISLDTNDDPDDLWQSGLDELLDLVDIVLPNDSEACRMTGATSAEAAADILGRRVPLVVIKCGSKGALVQSKGTRSLVPSFEVTPVDTIGAGDSFNAGFLSAFLRGKAPAECALEGNRVAALSTLRAGGTEAFRDAKLMRDFLAGTAQ
ncbi:MAG TPA: sugar kinase [Acidisarcina sp.]|nr:sugar kinase [Acidisarcina sp.]